jgi:hypothetical protein
MDYRVGCTNAIENSLPNPWPRLPPPKAVEKLSTIIKKNKMLHTIDTNWL